MNFVLHFLMIFQLYGYFVYILRIVEYYFKLFILLHEILLKYINILTQYILLSHIFVRFCPINCLHLNAFYCVSFGNFSALLKSINVKIKKKNK